MIRITDLVTRWSVTHLINFQVKTLVKANFQFPMNFMSAS